MFDVTQLTLGEVAAIEDLSGRSIDELDSENTPKGKLLAALAYVVKRRTGTPTYTWNEALGLTLTEASEIIGLDVDDDTGEAPTPTKAAQKPAAGKGKASSRGK